MRKVLESVGNSIFIHFKTRQTQIWRFWRILLLFAQILEFFFSQNITLCFPLHCLVENSKTEKITTTIHVDTQRSHQQQIKMKKFPQKIGEKYT